MGYAGIYIYIYYIYILYIYMHNIYIYIYEYDGPLFQGVIEGYRRLRVQGYLTPMMECQMDKSMEHEMETRGPFKGAYKDPIRIQWV